MDIPPRFYHGVAVVSRRTHEALVLKHHPNSHDPYRTVSVAGALIDAQQVSHTATITCLASAPGKHTVAWGSHHTEANYPGLSQ